MTASGMGTYIISLGILSVVAGLLGCLGDGWRGGYALGLLGLGLIMVGFIVAG
jgi:hypothetical protein